MSLRFVLYKYNPAIPRRWLLIIAGVIWTAVGAMLCWRAYGWLREQHNTMSVTFAFVGLALAIVSYRLMLARSATRNVKRILLLPERVCMFAFTPWRGYMTIALMILMGILLRSSSFPKEYLAVVYAGMGGALVLSSFIFYSTYWSSTRS